MCAVTGVGPGTGTALSRRFARGGYRVAMLARSEDRLAELEARIPDSRGYSVDVGDAAQVKKVFAQIREDLGPVSVLAHNAVSGGFATFMDTEPAMLERNFRTNVLGLLHCGQQVVPQMLGVGGGAIVVTGNTAALRGVARFAPFAPTKAAQRILAQSMARSLGPQGIHVAYVVIDAVIDLEWTRRAFPDQPDGFFIEPDAIADTVFHIARQPRSAWTFDVDLRPFGEKW